MADKKKMSVADILAAARKSDSKGGAGEDSPAPAEAASSPPRPAEAKPEAAPDVVSEKAAPEKSEKSKPTPAKGSGGGRPSVADMMAMARGEKAGPKEEKPEEKKPEQQKPAGKESPTGQESKKPGAKATPAAQPAAKKGATEKPAASAPKDTASILAAARSAARKGPMSKAEAAKAATVTAPSKSKAAVPRMPEKPVYAQAARTAKGPSKPKADQESRRGFLAIAIGIVFGSFMAIGFGALTATGALWSLAVARFMFPNVLREPPSQFKVGSPDSFAPGTVETKFKAQYGVWIVNTPYKGQQELVALKSVCTHLGCTPNWLEAEQKFKCPCHGSGFYKDGINFEGPAPRPLERYAISLADDGQVLIDKSQTFQEEMGQWTNPACYISV